jgi:hypothetical protein
MASLALAIGGIASVVGGVSSAVIGSNAATTAAGEQEQATEQGIAEQQREFNIEQQNAAPFVQAGQTSISDIMAGIQNGTFGPGSTPAFTAPTLAQAQQTPGYAFTQQQGDKGILEGAAAAGGAVSGGALKSLDQYNTNLANTTYSTIYNQALSTYGANLTNQAQQFSQLATPAQIGSGSTAAVNATGAQTSNSIANLLQSLGTSQAAGTVGSANAITSGITGATNNANSTLNNINQSNLMNQLIAKLSGGSPGSVPGVGVMTGGVQPDYGPMPSADGISD